MKREVLKIEFKPSKELSWKKLVSAVLRFELKIMLRPYTIHTQSRGESCQGNDSHSIEIYTFTRAGNEILL